MSDYARIWGFGPPVTEVPLGLPGLDDIPDACLCRWAEINDHYFRATAVQGCPVHPFELEPAS